MPPPHADGPPPLIHDTLAVIYKKKHTRTVVCRTQVDDKLDSAFRDFVRVYTDESVDRLHGTARAVANTPPRGVQASGRINFCAMSMTAELSAIRVASHLLLCHQTQWRAVSVTSSQQFSFTMPSSLSCTYNILILPHGVTCPRTEGR